MNSQTLPQDYGESEAAFFFFPSLTQGSVKCMQKKKKKKKMLGERNSIVVRVEEVVVCCSPWSGGSRAGLVIVSHYPPQ